MRCLVIGGSNWNKVIYGVPKGQFTLLFINLCTYHILYLLRKLFSDWKLYSWPLLPIVYGHILIYVVQVFSDYMKLMIGSKEVVY